MARPEWFPAGAVYSRPDPEVWRAAMPGGKIQGCGPGAGFRKRPASGALGAWRERPGSFLVPLWDYSGPLWVYCGSIKVNWVNYATLTLISTCYSEKSRLAHGHEFDILP